MSHRRSAPGLSPGLWCALAAGVGGLMGAEVASGHIVGNPVELAVVGSAAPFGSAGAAAYTALDVTQNKALLASDNAGVAIVSLSTFATLGTYTSASSPGFASVGAAGDGVHAFCASSSGDGVHVVGFSDPAHPALLTRITPDDGGLASASDLLVVCDTLYMCDASSGSVRVFDVSDPASPVFVRSIDTPESVGIRSLSESNRVLVVPGRDGVTPGDGAGAVYLYDVASIETGPAPLIATVPTLAEVSSAVVNAAHTRLFVTQRALGGATKLYDITNPQAPVLLSTVTAGDYAINAYSPLRASIVRQIVFVAWTQSGLQAMDLDQIDAQSLVQPVGYYDTSSESPFNGFTGAVATCPTFNPNVVLVADSRAGLVALSATPVYPTGGCVADLTGDDRVDIFDFGVFATSFGACDVAPLSEGDFDGDRDVDVFDFAVFAANFACGP